MKFNKIKYILSGALIISAVLFASVILINKSTEGAVVNKESALGIAGDPESGSGGSDRADSNDSAVQGVAGQARNDRNMRGGRFLYRSPQREGVIGLFAGKQTDNPADNIFTIHIDRELSGNDKVWLNFELAGVADFTGVAHSINDRHSWGGYMVKMSGESSPQRERLNPGWLKKGENSILFSLPENAGFGYKVSNVSIEVERNACASTELVINTSQSEYDGKACVYGFVQGAKGETNILIDGKETAMIDGAFEALVNLSESRSATVTAKLANGKKLERELVYKEGAAADAVFAFNNDIKHAEKIFIKGVAGKIQLETAELKIDSSGLLAQTKNIKLTTLRTADMPAMDMGMTNVTAERDGYRFLPHGEHFSADGATVSLKYDRTKIPNGYTENDIRTYWFDRNTGHWTALEKDSINRDLCMVVSKTTHFTDMINGVIKTPESPETQGFAPTMMNDVKAADPASKIALIAPPTANNRGTAGLSYSFEMPPARNGMQPQLGLQYNSDAGGGWCGEGWDVNVPSISIDTRWGVPRYNAAMETETYSMDGEMLATMDDSGQTSVAHRGEKIARKADRQFYARNEGAFSRIIRKGNDPGNYYWEATDKNGTVYTYGGAGAVLSGEVTALDGTKKTVIAKWMLSKVKELHGDSITYTYRTVEEPVIKGILTAKAIYLSTVSAGDGGDNPSTVVSFISNHDRQKKTNNARFGFLTSSNELLDSVTVAFEREPLRSYGFSYATGAFFADLLQSVTHYDNEGKAFATHTFDYYDDVNFKDGYQPFQSKAENWNMGNNDNINAGFVNNLPVPDFSDKASALGGSKTTSISASIFAGVGFGGNIFSKELTAGLSYSYTNATTEGMVSLIDINGDGLPDKVYVKDGKLYYRPNISKPADTVAQYGIEIAIQGVSQFSKTKTVTNAFGGKAYTPFASAGVDGGITSSTTSVYFSDVNNDGLIDIVSGGNVYFNHLEYDGEGNAIPRFTLSSADTPSPIMGGGVIYTDSTKVDPVDQATAIQNSPLLDVVRVWQAPFGGTVQIEGNVRLLNPEGDYDAEEYANADGVRVAIQAGASEKWSQSIAKGDTADYPANVSNITVTKDDKIYFRVQSGDSEMANGAFDQVLWSPVVTYTTASNPADLNQINPDGQKIYRFPAAEADVHSQSGATRVADFKTAKLSGKFVKPVTSDDIVLKVVQADDSMKTSKVIYNKTYSRNEIFNGDLDIMINDMGPNILPDSLVAVCDSSSFPFGGGVQHTLNDLNNNSKNINPDRFVPIPLNFYGPNFYFYIQSETNVDWEKVKWTPYLQTDSNSYAMPATVDYDIYRQVSKGDPFITTTDSVNLLITPLLTPKDGLPQPLNGNIVVSVKSAKGLLSKTTVKVTDSTFPATALSLFVAKPDTVWIEAYTQDKDLSDGINSITAKIEQTGAATPAELPVNLFLLSSDDGFGRMYRNWGQFVYNANDGRYGSPIDQDKLTLPQDSTQADPMKMAFFPMSLDATSKSYWAGQNVNAFIKADTISSSRLGDQDVVLTNPLEGLGNPSENVQGDCMTGTGAKAPSLKTKGSSVGFLAGVGSAPLTRNQSAALGGENTLISFTDMNGDGYPDIISNKQIQYTNTRGGFDGETADLSSKYTAQSNNSSYSVGSGGSVVLSHSTTASSQPSSNSGSGQTKGTSGTNSGKRASDSSAPANGAAASNDNAKINLNMSGDLNFNLDSTMFALIDVNGDGLPDKVMKDGNKVCLNLGYGFTPEVDWGITDIQNGSATTKSAGLGLGFDYAQTSFAAGFGITATTSNTNYILVDVNGDGLPDKLWQEGDWQPGMLWQDDSKVHVSLNTGNGFADEIIWSGPAKINESSSASESLNIAATVGFPLATIIVVVNPGVNIGKSMSRPTFDIRDVDGDGFPEIVSSDNDASMTVYRSTIARTNKLKDVYNPLGGSFTLDYARSEATYDHPGGKWVMSSVEVDDGVSDDGANMRTEFDYSGGKHDRHEREFLGFGQVVSKSVDTGNSNAVYRKSIQEYDVQNIYTAGNEIRSRVEDANGNKYTENENEYYLYEIAANADNYTFKPMDNANCSDHSIAFSPLKYSKSTVYEGQAEGMTANESFYNYYLDGYHGELQNYTYSDMGSLGADGSGAFNYRTVIAYTGNHAKHIFGLPSKMQVQSSNGVFRQIEAAYDTTFANHLIKITQTLDRLGGKTAVTDIEYNKQYGYITKKTLPENSNGQRMSYKYTYENDYHQYLIQIDDTFKYRSTLENYDYSYGIPRTVKDMNGYSSETVIDNLGRITSIAGPLELADSQSNDSTYTVKFEYLALPGNEQGVRRYARTTHYDTQHKNDGIQTVTFSDGIGRPIQVKKTGVVFTSPNPSTGGGQEQEVMLVSGRVKYDPFGRVAEAFYPVTEDFL